MLMGIVEHSVRGVLEDLVDELIAESLPNIWRGPEYAEGDTALEDGVSAGADTRTGCDEDNPVEHGDDPQNAACGDPTDP